MCEASGGGSAADLEKSNGEIVEAALCPDLAEYELAVNLPMPGKRKRQGAECLDVFYIVLGRACGSCRGEKLCFWTGVKYLGKPL